MRPRWRLGPLDHSDGTSPTQAMNWRAVAKRRRSPASAAIVTAERRDELGLGAFTGDPQERPSRRFTRAAAASATER
jgi:hypothetical protein